MRAPIGMEDESYLELLLSYLWDQGVETEIAASATECVTIMRDFEPDVVVMEHDLPWGGIRALQTAMDDDSRLGRIPVVIIANSRQELDPGPVRDSMSRL